MRDTKPDAQQKNVEDRDQDQLLRSKELNRDTEWFGTEVGFLDGKLPALCGSTVRLVLHCLDLQIMTCKRKLCKKTSSC